MEYSYCGIECDNFKECGRNMPNPPANHISFSSKIYCESEQFLPISPQSALSKALPTMIPVNQDLAIAFILTFQPLLLPPTVYFSLSYQSAPFKMQIWSYHSWLFITAPKVVLNSTCQATCDLSPDYLTTSISYHQFFPDLSQAP